jgi:hypothetical protein
MHDKTHLTLLLYRVFVQSHEYLVTLLQHTGAESLSPAATSRTTNVRLSFNHPVKTLAWVVKNGNTHGRYTTQASGETSDKFAPIKSVRLQLNGTYFLNADLTR